MDSDGYGGSIIFLAVIMLYKGFCAVCESAVTEADDRKIKSAESGSLLAGLLDKPSRLLNTFSVNRIITAVLMAYAAMFSFSASLAAVFSGLLKNEAAGLLLGWLLILLGTVLVLNVFCEGVPKRLPAAKSEKFARFCAPFVRFLVIILTPMTALSALLIRLLSPIFGGKASAEQDIVTEEEILMMVDAGSENGVVEESQREMIRGVFEFDDRDVADIMTHRTDITAVEAGAKVSDLVNAAISTGFSRIPVYEENVDRIVGMICVKDLLCLVGSEAAENAEIKNFVRDMIYLPESVSCGDAFKQLTAKKMQMAVVIDEYGGTAGLVTMEDIVESIVGNIRDEYDDEEEEFTKISDDTYIVNGIADPEKILPVFGIKLPEENGFNTMSGFVVELLGRIPEENENPAVQYENVLFTVLVTEDKCIAGIKAEILNNNTNQNEKESTENEEEN